MHLKRVQKLLNECWKATEAERLLLGNSSDVFVRLTGHDCGPVSSKSTRFYLNTYFTDHVYLTFLPNRGDAIINRKLLEESLKKAAEELGLNYGTQTT